jgi:hypothetical protein
MVAVTGRLAKAVAPGGHLRETMFLAADLLPALPEDFEPFVVEQRSREVTRDAKTSDIEDSTLFARRAG